MCIRACLCICDLLPRSQLVVSCSCQSSLKTEIATGGQSVVCVFLFIFSLFFVVAVVVVAQSHSSDLKFLFKIQGYLIREIKMWLNVNHITVHNNSSCIF